MSGEPSLPPAARPRESDMPHLRPALRVMGKTLALRDVHTDDAAFILALRTDASKARHLSSVGDDLEVQRRWIDAYCKRRNEAYFIIESLSGQALGTVRLYDDQGDSFCWGSWILVDGAPASAAIESALMVYAYALDHLGFRRAHFQVRRANERVWSFHERFGARRVAETDIELHYEIAGDAIRASMQRYRRYLPDGIEVQR
jgi:RimJ/RimL family protein N-acetyltransferase